MSFRAESVGRTLLGIRSVSINGGFGRKRASLHSVLLPIVVGIIIVITIITSFATVFAIRQWAA